ncbi:MAG TPA: hypothetical protein VD948_07665 [Rhodothermales bacterium]|nr:hypothetical protein [Rhodothermales bacterium]
MDKSKVITALSVLVAVSGAIGTQIEAVNPTAAVVVALLGAGATALSGSLVKVFEHQGVAVVAAAAAVVGAVAPYVQVLNPKVGLALFIAGTALSAASKSLLGGKTPEPPAE